MLFTSVVDVYSNNYTKFTQTLCRQTT